MDIKEKRMFLTFLETEIKDHQQMYDRTRDSGQAYLQQGAIQSLTKVKSFVENIAVDNVQ